MTSLLRLQDVTHRFGKIVALDGLNLSVPEGEIYGFLGRNGAGKTTTLRMLMGLASPDAGRIELFGEEVRKVPVRLKQRIGFVPQEPHFYPWMTALELGRFVGGFYPGWDGAGFERLLRRLDIPLDRKASAMSGGTRTKLSLALAFGARPPLLLLDEPTTGLDPVARREFNDQLIELQREQGTTVMFSSHLVGEVEQVAHAVGIIQAGKTRFEGSVASLRTQVRRIVGLAGPLAEPWLERVRGDVYRASADAWNANALPPGASVETLGLEDIFLAFARTDEVQPAEVAPE
jgi:ABC-2 type transport system ATP-binding protein